MARAQIMEALLLLMPRDAVGVGKLRLGGPHDGGYVLLDRLDPAQAVMSFGVGPTVTFDRELAERGHAVLLFDHTVDALPEEHPRFTWFREGVSGIADPEASLFPLAHHMARLPAGTTDPILKMDVEGAEWDAIGMAPSGLLRRFAQITVEFHTLLRLDDAAFRAQAMRAWRALAADFAVVHVHGNNFGETGFVGGLPLPDTIEVSYARRDLFPTAPSATFYPTPYDTPNFDERPDIPLWFYPFHPGGEALAPI